MHAPALAAVAALALAAIALPVAAAPRLEPFAATFEGHKTIAMLDVTAEALVELRRSPTHAIYTVSATARWTALSRRYEQCSVVRFDGDRIVPLEYVHIDHAKPTRNVRTVFDWARSKAVTRLGDGNTVGADITKSTLDPMSLQLALMAEAPSKAPGERQTYSVVERGVAKAHHVTFVGTSAHASGNERAFEIRSEKPSGRTAAMLLDAAQGWQPMRIGIEDVSLDRTSRRAPPGALAPGEVPTCPGPRAP